MEIYFREALFYLKQLGKFVLRLGRLEILSASLADGHKPRRCRNVARTQN